MTATERLRELLDERGVEWEAWNDRITVAPPDTHYLEISDGSLCVAIVDCTPEQAIAATLGQVPWVNPTWERWHKSLKHDEIKSIGDAVEQLMYEAIEFGGDMGPNGNTYNGIDEGDVLTMGFINEWVARFEATLGAGQAADEWGEGFRAGCDAANKASEESVEHYKAENAKLREELELWHRLTAGIELPEYPMTQFQPCEHFEPKVVDE